MQWAEASLHSKSSFLSFSLPSSPIPSGNFPGDAGTELKTGKPPPANGAAGGGLGVTMPGMLGSTRRGGLGGDDPG